MNYGKTFQVGYVEEKTLGVGDTKPSAVKVLTQLNV